MEGVISAICQFCLQQTLPIVNNSNIENMVKTFFPFKDNKIKNSSICPACSRKLESVYQFALTANENNSKILDATIENDDEVCQTCLNPVANPHIFLYYHFENVAPFSVIQKMLKGCLIKLDLGYRRNPIMCDICWEVLQTSYRQQKLATVGVEDLKKFNEYNADIPGPYNEILFLDICRDNRPDAKKNAVAEEIFSELQVEMEEKTIRRAVKVENETDLEPAEFVESAPIEFVPVGKNVMPQNDISIKIEDVTSDSDEVDSEASVVVNDIDCSSAENDVKKLYVNLERTNFEEKLGEVPVNRTIKELEKQQKHKCHLCSYSTNKKYTFKHHLTTHMTLEECARNNTLFHCSKCSYRSKRKYGLAQHVKRIHNSDSSESPELPSKSDDKIQEEKTSRKLSKFNKIILKCSHCNFETKSYDCLDEHALTHRNTRTKKVYKCEVCGYEVKKKSGISRHIVIHSSKWELSKYDKLYRCDMCSYKVKRKDCLVQHMQKHKKSKKKSTSTIL